jgi:hypothetical protein
VNVIGVGGAVGGLTHGITHGARAVGGGLKGLVSQTGRMFEDVSTHSDTGGKTNGQRAPVAPAQRAAPVGTASKVLGDMKNVFGSLNAFGPTKK